jgi:dipeptidyl aminopeptidase/acylaminoacyl peptidase
MGLYITDPQGAAQTLVAEGRYKEVAWSPDGTHLAMVASPKDGPRTLHVVPADGGKATVIPAELAEGPWAPAWSPDGGLLSLVLAAGGEQQLAVVPAGGGTPEVLATGSAIGTAVWSAEGGHVTVALAEDESASHRLVKVEVGGSGSLEELGPGEFPCAVAGLPLASDEMLEADTPLANLRRAELYLVSGGWS